MTVRQSGRHPFVAVHRGGPLTKENHRRLMRWARACSEHVLHLIKGGLDERLVHALSVAGQWENGTVPAGAAMKASLDAHAVARNAEDPVYKAVARSIGQTAATAHMADHSLGGAYYALKAIKLANRDLEGEKNWQTGKLMELPREIVESVHAMWIMKELDRRI